MLRCICRPQRVLPVGLSRPQHMVTIRRRQVKRYVSSTIEERLHQHFNRVMKTENVPLFESFDCYKGSLPVRRDDFIGKEVPLYTLPYFVSEDSIASMAHGLLHRGKERALVKYLSAPGASGKTSAILPAFLMGTKIDGGFTHYVYLPFDNNNFRYYKLDPESNEVISVKFAEKQGASFIYECLQHLLMKFPGERDYPFYLPCNTTPPNWDTTMANMNTFLDDKIGPHHRVLFHLDEHRKMCQRGLEGYEDMCPGALFSRGAMRALANLPGAFVVATYTRRPPLPPKGSSGVCRYPVSMPCLDLNAAIEHIPELKFPQTLDSLDKAHRRVLATLRFRLGISIQYEYGLGCLHRQRDDFRRELLAPFDREKRHSDTKQALINCTQVCKFPKYEARSDPNAARLLVGIADVHSDTIERQVYNVVVVGNIISCSLPELIGMRDPNVTVHDRGRERFVKTLLSPDSLSGTPLEAAYSWTLSCRSALEGGLDFNNTRFNIICNTLQPGRLFSDTGTNNHNNFCDLNSDVMYYADEWPSNTHPLCDIFFRTSDNVIVLVDITGGNELTVREKKSRLANWIEQQGEVNLVGVVLAPLCTGESTSHGQVHVLRSDEAKRHLGGLAQVLQFFEEPMDSNFKTLQ